jgi:aminoglycoside phosphotransferase (APT) family kinase protein
VIPADAARKMHADEVDVDEALVRRLVAEQLPHWADLTIELVPDWGTDNALYRLGDDMVVRLPRIPRATLALDKEIAWLPRLAPHVPLAIPVPLAFGEPGDGYPFKWSVYTWLQGETASPERIDDETRAAIDLAQLIAALQRIDAADGPPPGEHNVFRGVPLAVRDGSTRASLAALAGRVDSDAATAAWEEALAAPDWPHEPVWVHGDLDSRNLLVAGGRLSGVVDWGCLGVGDPACDVAVVWKMLTADTRDAFRAELAVDDATWARSRGWALSQAVNVSSYYTLETNPVLLREAEQWLAEVLAER